MIRQVAKKIPPLKWLVIIASLFLVAYSLFEFRHLLLGPKLEVTTPITGEIISDALVNIEGRAVRIAKIYMNDRQIFVDKQGHFNEPLLLSGGYNIIKLHAEDQFNQKIEKTIELVLR